eukprot:3980546-Pyramimonas_sp.AAC.3
MSPNCTVSTAGQSSNRHALCRQCWPSRAKWSVWVRCAVGGTSGEHGGVGRLSRVVRVVMTRWSWSVAGGQGGEHGGVIGRSRSVDWCSRWSIGVVPRVPWRKYRRGISVRCAR